MVTTAWVVVGAGTGIELLRTGTGIDGVGLSGELLDELETGTGLVVTGVAGMVEVDGVEAGGATHLVQTVDVLVMKIVEIVDVVSREVVVPLVTMLVTGHVVNVVTITSVVKTGTVVPGVIVGETGEFPVVEVVGIVSTGTVDSGMLDTGVEYTEVKDSGVVVEGVGTMAVDVYDEIGTVSGVVSGVVTGTVGPVGPAEVVELTVGIGYGFVS